MKVQDLGNTRERSARLDNVLNEEPVALVNAVVVTDSLGDARPRQETPSRDAPDVRARGVDQSVLRGLESTVD